MRGLPKIILFLILFSAIVNTSVAADNSTFVGPEQMVHQSRPLVPWPETQQMIPLILL